MTIEQKETIVLIHGAWDTSKTWGRLTPFLEEYGHRIVALDLPGHGEDETEIKDQTMKTYVDAVEKAIQALEGRIVLAGNSMGGTIISNVAERIPQKVKKLIYITAFMLKDGQSLNGTDGSGIIPVNWRAHSEDGLTAKFVETIFIEGDRKQTINKPRIKPPVMYESIDALTSKVQVTEMNWGQIPRYYVKCTKDIALPPPIQQQMIDALPCHAVYEIESGHSPQIQKPAELAEIIQKIID
ncbi:alpha/beta hydrolase [Fusibacter paucivorans]|uniref:Alpha/beta hydrolase n=1 Tax=Fusibacter paucivorans TaxID=76009 RepID=A0ABS5PRH2_9FIRM|nr:alpha/beta hydrolase [Fusibacter paucivorans]MBS7527487.1 alpha/beta hydrolase [Fusibacter paucivorans]